MNIIKDDNGFPIKCWTDHVPVENQAKDQLLNISRMPFIHKHIAVMPDVHLGIGATVGSVIPTKGAIIPAAVGVDIGCGMMAWKTSINANDLPDNLKEIRATIESVVPVGNGAGGSFSTSEWGKHFQNSVDNYLNEGFNNKLDDIKHKTPKIKTNAGAQYQMGTLGGGNHFIEVCLDEQNNVWVMLHSGSRGIGNVIGRTFIELAKKDMERMFINLPDKNLAYLTEGSDVFDDYCEAVAWAQEYALRNRVSMKENIINALDKMMFGGPGLMTVGRSWDAVDEAVNCHHNYISREHHYGSNVWVTRKGAVSAKEGQLGIIPGSMGARSFIVRGKGDAQSFHSCSHGAGRIMSRSEAKRVFTLDDQIAQTEGVECRKDEGVIDEIPGAYKDIDDVMKSQEDLVEVVCTLKQVVCVKG